MCPLAVGGRVWAGWQGLSCGAQQSCFATIQVQILNPMLHLLLGDMQMMIFQCHRVVQ